MQTIEDLFERRQRVRDESYSPLAATSWNTKLIETEDSVFETIVVHLNYARDVVSFSKENDAVFYKIANEVMRLPEQTPYPHYLRLESRNSQGQINRVCRIDDDRLVFQQAAIVENNKLAALDCFQFLAMVLKAAQKLCAHVAFYGDISVGLNIANAQNLCLAFPREIWIRDDYKSDQWRQISISRTLHFDDFTNLSQTIQGMFSEFCRFFHLALDSKKIEKIVEEYFMSLLM